MLSNWGRCALLVAMAAGSIPGATACWPRESTESSGGARGQAELRLAQDGSYRPGNQDVYGPGNGSGSRERRPDSNGAYRPAGPGSGGGGGERGRHDDAYRPEGGHREDAYRPAGPGSGGGGGERGRHDGAYRPEGGHREDAYRPAGPGSGGGGGERGRHDDAYRPGPAAGAPSAYSPDRRYTPAPDSGYGTPYEPPRTADRGGPYGGNGPNGPYGNDPYEEEPPPGTYSQNEILAAGGRFFGAVSEGLARVIERAFAQQGRPNGYILGEDAGGAFVAGLRYGQGILYTKRDGDHRVYWQGPSVGYDFGGEGSKTMVLVYNLRSPSDIYHRFAGVQGSAYVVGGVGLQFQKYGDIVLAPIRSGVGLRLGANVGYLKYTPHPTWNPF